MSNAPTLSRLEAFTAKVAYDLREPYGATAERTAEDAKRYTAAMMSPYPLNDTEAALLGNIKEASQAFMTAHRTSGHQEGIDALFELFRTLEKVERHLPASGNPRLITGAQAASLAAIAQAALGVRYTNHEEGKAAMNAAVYRLFALLDEAKKTLAL